MPVRFRVLPITLLALAACAGASGPPGPKTEADTRMVRLDVADGPIDPSSTTHPGLYAIPFPPGTPDAVVSDFRMQALAMFGREDLIAGGNAEYAPSACAASAPLVDGEDRVLDAIAAQAAKTSIVIINESHFVTRHRALIEDLLRRLRPLGYNAYAAETFVNTAGAGGPIERGAMLPYARYGDGHYSSEPAFGRLIRTAKTLGYRLVPYESTGTPDPDADPVVSMNAREADQADNIQRFLTRAAPGTRLIVHVGYAHARESSSMGVDWLAQRIKQATGVDPLTIGQTDCRGGRDLALADGRTPDKLRAFDLSLIHPVTPFDHHRPAWTFARGAVPVAVPEVLVPATGGAIIEARRWDEPDAAVPVDRVYLRAGESDVMLALPPGRYRVRAVRTDI